MKKFAGNMLILSLFAEFMLSMFDYFGLCEITGKQFLALIIFQILQIEIMGVEKND